MNQNKILPPAEYKWLYGCAKTSSISIKDIADIYNVTAKIMRYRIERGIFPPADFKTKLTFSKASQLRWYVPTVINQVLIDVHKGQVAQYAEQIGV